MKRLRHLPCRSALRIAGFGLALFGLIGPLTAQELQPAPPAQPLPRIVAETIEGPLPDTLDVPMNKARMFAMPRPIRDVIVADPAIADVVVQTPTRVYLVAKSLGDTNIFFVARDGEVIKHMQVHVHIDLDSARKAIKESLPTTQVELDSVNQTIVLKGFVKSPRESADAASIAARFVEKKENVINILRILSDQQVLLQVRVAEIQRNVVKNLAAATRFNRLIRGRNLNFTTSGGSAFATAVTGTINLNYLGLVSTDFSALESQGLVKTLAEPVLTTISGETATFLAGGEYPAPSGIDSNGNLIIQFREFGVTVSFTPVVLDDERISMKISTEVSRLASENKLDLPFNDTTVPVLGLTVRRAASTVNLPSGGSLMIAGLIQNDEFNSVSGVPGLKDIPVLGALFRSQQFQHNETELVLLVRVFQVRPVEQSQQLNLPTDGFVPSSDFDIYLLGKLYKQYSKDKVLKEMPQIEGSFGYLME